MPYNYENVKTAAAPALLSHPDFDARLRPLLDRMCDAIRRGEAGAPYMPPAQDVARELYGGNHLSAEFFVWCCARSAEIRRLPRRGERPNA